MDAEAKRKLAEKVHAGSRLDRADGLALLDCDELAWLGRLAHRRRTDTGDDTVTFAVDRPLPLTGPDGDALPADELARRAAALAGDRPTEVRLDPGPDGAPADPAPVRAVREALPGVGLRAYTVVDVLRTARVTDRSTGAVLDDLVGAGLAGLTGSGVAPGDRADPDRDRERVTAALRLARARGLDVPGTVGHGHGERPADLVDHLLWLRARHDDDGGFPVVTVVTGAAVAPADALRTFAVVRLLLDGVPRVGCAWSAYGSSLAQLGLQFGVADLDGAADATDVRAELTHLIWDGGFRPVERDVRHAVRHTYDPAPSLASRRAEPQRVWA